MKVEVHDHKQTPYGPWCYECKKFVNMVVVLGEEEDDYDICTARVCPECLRKAVLLLEAVE